MARIRKSRKLTYPLTPQISPECSKFLQGLFDSKQNIYSKDVEVPPEYMAEINIAFDVGELINEIEYPWRAKPRRDEIDWQALAEWYTTGYTETD